MRKSNIESVRVIVSKAGTDVVKVTYYSGRTRHMTISTMSKSVQEFITGNCNTIVKELEDKTVTTFYASIESLNNAIEVIKERIVKYCMNSVETTKYIFGSERFSLNANDFKIQCGKLYFNVSDNRAITINIINDWDFNKAREVRDTIIEHFKG